MNKRLDSISREVFAMPCMFHSSPLGTIEAFRMRSGRYVIAKLIESDRISYIFEDTGQRDQKWEVLDEMDTAIKCMDRFATDVRMKSGKEFTIDECELMTRRIGIGQRPIAIPVGWTPRLRQPNKTLFAVRCKLLDRQDHCTAF